MVDARIGTLSGGERSRLLLAREFARPSNLLVLDEPTNDLDLETLDLLQEVISDYDGTVLIVSHDRDFLDRTVTSVIAPDGGGRWIEYAGGYSDMLTQRKGALEERKRAEKAAEKPKVAGTAASAGETSKGKGKLSFKQKFALENLPKEMAKAEADIAAREKKMADPNLFTKDPASFNRLAAEMEKLRDSVLKMEEEWLELEMLREELEG
jgi:ATP-binding cassette subfamily F protein uup